MINGGKANINNTRITGSTKSAVTLIGTSSSAKICNTTITNSEKGIKIEGGTPDIKNVTFDNCNHSLWIEKSVIIENSTMTNSISDNFYLSNSINLKTINCYYDNRNNITPGSTLYKQWHVNIYVNDSFGNPLDNVDIKITPNGQSPVGYKTDSSGWKRWIVCTELENTHSGIIYRTPYNITVNKTGYNSTTIYPNIKDKRTFYFTLKDTTKPNSMLNEIPDYWFNRSTVELDYIANDNSYIKKVSLYNLLLL